MVVFVICFSCPRRGRAWGPGGGIACPDSKRFLHSCARWAVGLVGNLGGHFRVGTYLGELLVGVVGRRGVANGRCVLRVGARVLCARGCTCKYVKVP